MSHGDDNRKNEGRDAKESGGTHGECLDHLLGRNPVRVRALEGPHPLIGRFQATRRLRIVLPSSTRWSFPVRRIRQTQDQMYFLQGQTCLLSKIR